MREAGVGRFRAGGSWGLAAIALLACGQPPAIQSHPLRGQVIEVRRGGAEVVLAHEAIPEVMEAMTMALPVADPVQGRELAPGDKIRCELVIEGHQHYLRAIEPLPEGTRLELASP